MEFRHLRYFCSVAEEQSFTAAARRLHVSQSGVSGQIKDLEAELGVSLLKRSQRKVSLTPEGAVFLPHAKEILERMEEARRMMERASQGQYGRLAIGLCGPATAPFLPRLIRQFRKAHPGVNLTLKDIEPAQQPAALANRDIDVGFTRNVPAHYRATLGSEVLFQEPILAVLPGGHALEREESVSLAQLAGDSFILYARENAPELYDAVIAWCKKAKFSPRVVDSPKLWQSVLTMAEAGEGVSLVPASVRHLKSEGLLFKPVRNRGCWVDVVLAWREDDADAIRDRFLGLLRKNRNEIARSA